MGIKLNSQDINRIKLNDIDVTKVTLNGNVVYQVFSSGEIMISILPEVVEKIGTQYIIDYSAMHNGPTGLEIELQIDVYINGFNRGTFIRIVDSLSPVLITSYAGFAPACEYIEFENLKESINFNGVEYEMKNNSWGDPGCKM